LAQGLLKTSTCCRRHPALLLFVLVPWGKHVLETQLLAILRAQGVARMDRSAQA